MARMAEVLLLRVADYDTVGAGRSAA
jgi:hypothetical protein